MADQNLEFGNREPGTGNREPGTGNREPDVALGDSTDNLNRESEFAEDDCARPITDHRDLDVWKLSMSFATEIYRITEDFPDGERYGLISQLRRASVSIPTNIAEGYGRETSGSYVQFLRVAQGSAKELQTLIELSSRLNLLSAADKAALEKSVDRITMMLFRLIRAIERNKSR